MILFSRICLYAITVLAMASVLPTYIKQIFPLGFKTTIIAYSADRNKLIFSKYTNGEWSYEDSDGKQLTKEESQRALPFKNLHSLMRNKQLPERVGSWKFDAETAVKYIDKERLSANRLDKPDTGLYTLMESKPGIKGFASPDDLFRMTANGVEFIDLETNKINSSKSKYLSDLMHARGFKFPHRFVADSPSTRKAIDNGVLLVDSDYRVFHLKLLDGEIQLMRTNAVLPKSTISIDVLEQLRKEYHGVVTTASDIYLLRWDDYSLVRIPFSKYDPFSENVAMDGDYLNWEFSRALPDSSRRDFVLTDRNITPSLAHHWKLNGEFDARKSLINNGIGFFFPYYVKFSLHERSQNNIYLRGVQANWWVIALGILVSIGAYVLCWRKRAGTLPPLSDILFLSVSGFYGLIVLLILGPLQKKARRFRRAPMNAF